MSRVCLLALSALLACVRAYGDPVQGRDCREFREEYDRAIDCPYGMYNWTLNGCTRWKCKEDPCLKINCSSSKHCERVEREKPNDRGDLYSAFCAPGPDCKPFQRECSRLQHCDFGIEKINDTDGCERCKCKQNPCKTIRSCAEGKRCVLQKSKKDQQHALYAECITMMKAGACPMEETSPLNDNCPLECADDADCQGVGKCCRRGCSLLCLAPVALTSILPFVPAKIDDKGPDCKPFQRECSRLQHCDFGIEKINDTDGCERCKCKQNPCKTIRSCAEGKRCVLQKSKKDQQHALYAECITMMKAGACPMEETSPLNDNCPLECADDADCQGVGKCCRRGCSLLCLAPVALTSILPFVPAKIDDKVPVSTHMSKLPSNIGAELHLMCEVSGFPKPDVHWTKDGANIQTDDGRITITGSTIGSLLRVTRVTVADSGLYACHASNPYSSQSDAAQITVRHSMPRPTTAKTTTTEVTRPIYTAPVSTHVSKRSSTLNIGADLRLMCEVYGLPKPDVHWTKDGANIQTDYGRITITGSTIVSLLMVTRVTVADSGLYACHASNPYSSQSDTAQIAVRELVVPATCYDKSGYAFCVLIVNSNYCRYKYYSRLCCKSCVDDGQLDTRTIF